MAATLSPRTSQRKSASRSKPKKRTAARTTTRSRCRVAKLATPASEGDTHCYVAIHEAPSRPGVGRVCVMDRETETPHWFTFPVTLFGSVYCVRLRSLGITDGLHLAKLPIGGTVYVRDVRDTLAVARGLRLLPTN
jgi:hypothetical protein